MTNPMLAELDEVVRLSECATPGPWHRHTDCPGKCCWHIFTAPDGIYGPEPEGKGDSSLINSPEMAEEDASYIVALSNFLRTHHATLADMAKRLEAAERDAKGERSESWEVWQDDMCVAGSDSLADAQHYMMMYGQDGPVKMVHVVTFRSDVIETVPADQLAIDATQEGEG